MKIVKKIFVLIMLLFCFNNIFSQRIPFFIEISPKYGGIFPHHPEIRSLISSNIWSYNLQIGIQTLGNKQWQSLWNYPELGIGFYFANHGNDTLGKAFATYFFTDLQIFKKANYKTKISFSVGSAYITRPFSLESNPFNFVIGAHWNIFADIKLKNEFHFDNFVLTNSIGWTHYSDGGTKMPNLGLNIIGLQFGLKYYLHYYNTNRRGFARKNKKYDFLFLSTVGLQQKFLSEPQFIVSDIIFEVGYFLSPKSKIFTGIDFTYNKRTEYIDSLYGFNAVLYAPSFGYSAVFGNVEFILKNSYRLKKITNDFSVYQTYGFRLTIKKFIVLNLTLNTHWFNAQYIQAGAGFKL